MRDDFTPYCETSEGCPIGNLASDPELNASATRWITWRALFEINKDQETYKRMCEEFGLYDDLGSLFKLERIWREYHSNSQKTDQ